MALTRPRLGQLVTNVVNLTDNITVINSAATQANVDVGFLFNRTDGVGSVPNVALYWNETLKSFSFATTADSDSVSFANINATSWANVTAGNITANGFFWPNGASYGASIIAAQSIYSNANVAAYLITNTGNIQAGNITTIGVSGNISNVSYILATGGVYSGNVQAGNVIVGTGLFFSNGTPFSTGTASVSGLNGQLQYNNNGVLAGANVSYFGSNVTLVANANITSSGNIITTGNIVGGGVRSTTSSTPPANPVPGDVWYNSTTDAIYRYTQDSTSSYWLNVFAPAVTSNSSVITTTTSANANVASYVTVAGGGFPSGVYYIPFGNVGNYTGNTQLGSSTNFFYNSSSGILAAPTGAFNQINAQVSPFNLIPTTISQMNFGNAATNIFMGASSGLVQIAGNLTLPTGSGYFAGPFNESDTRSGVFVGNTGTAGGLTPRVAFFNGNTTQNWEIDNYNGQFRWFTPGVTRMNLDGNTNQLTVYGNVSSTANVIASAAIVSGNAVVSGIGGVSQPNIPAFRVTGNGGAISATTTVSSGYFVVDYNQGSYLNTSTGYFTAPVAGLYQVNIVCRANGNNLPSAQVIIRKTTAIGSVTTSIVMLEWASNTTVNHMGGGTVIKLAVGDTLRFDVTVGTVSFDGNDNWSVAFLG